MKNDFVEIYLVRHGQTEWNLLNQLQGHANIPLNDTGKAEALKLKEKFKSHRFAAVYSSDLVRASETASIIASDSQIIHTTKLRERNLGPWEGCTKKMLDDYLVKNGVFPSQFSREEFLSYKWDGHVESYKEAYTRFDYFIKSTIVSHLGESVLIVAHGGLSRAILYHITDFDCEMRWQVSNCAIIKIKVDAQGHLKLGECDGAHRVKMSSIIF